MNRSSMAPACQSLECRLVTRNRGTVPGATQASQSTSPIRRSRSANVRTVNPPTRTSTRVAHRRNRLAA